MAHHLPTAPVNPAPHGRFRWFPIAVVVAAVLAVVAGAMLGTSTTHTPPKPLPGADTAAEETTTEAADAPNEGGLEVVESGWSVSDDGAVIHWGAIVENTSDILLTHAVVSFGKVDTDREDRTDLPALLPGERFAVGSSSTIPELVNGDDRELTFPKAQWAEPDGTSRSAIMLGVRVVAGWVDPDADDAYWTSGEPADSRQGVDHSVVRFEVNSTQDVSSVFDPIALFRDDDGDILGVDLGVAPRSVAVPSGESTHTMSVEFPPGTDLDSVEVYLKPQR